MRFLLQLPLLLLLLHLQGNTSLRSLSLGGCRLGGLQGLEELCKAFRNNKSLKHLSLRGMQIGPVRV